MNGTDRENKVAQAGEESEAPTSYDVLRCACCGHERYEHVEGFGRCLIDGCRCRRFVTAKDLIDTDQPHQ